MVQTVQLPNGEIHEFPDEATPEQMKKALSGYIKSKSAEMNDHFDPSFMEKLGPNIIAGLAEGGHEILNTPYKLAKSAQGNNLLSKLGVKAEDVPHQQDYDYAKLLKLPDEATPADKIVRGAAQYAPAFLAPEAELGEAGAAISKIPSIGKYLKRSAEIGAPQAAVSATQSEDPLKGAVEGAATGLVAPGLEKFINALRPSRLLKSNLSPEELTANLEATQGTNTGLGRIIDNPRLNRLQENILPHVYGSGAEKTMQNTANQVTDKAENLLEKIRNNLSPSDLSTQLQTAMKRAAENARKEKNAGYEELNNLADKTGLIIGRDNFQKTADSILEDIGISPELQTEFTPELLKDLQRYASNPEGNNLKLTNIFRGKLGDKANDLYQKGKMHEYGIVKSLKESLSKDIDESFEKQGTPELKNLYQQNQKDYAEKFAPFEDPDIVKFTRKGGDPDLILPHFLRGGKNDRATLLRKLLEGSPQKQQDLQSLLSYAHFSKAVDDNGVINPVKLSSLYSKLGNNQRKVLIPNENMRNELKRFSILMGKNREPFDLMRNPKTGARGTDSIVKILQAALGSSGGIPGIAASVFATGAAGNITNKLLTSPKIRESLVKKMIENKDIKLPGSMLGTGMLNALINSNSGE